MEYLVRCVPFIFVNLNIYLLFILVSNYPSKEPIRYKPLSIAAKLMFKPYTSGNICKLAKEYSIL